MKVCVDYVAWVYHKATKIVDQYEHSSLTPYVVYFLNLSNTWIDSVYAPSKTSCVCWVHEVWSCPFSEVRKYELYFFSSMFNIIS